MIGKIPTKYIEFKNECEIVDEICKSLFNQQLYYHQLLIFYYGISKYHNRIAVITPTRFGKSFTLSLIALYHAKLYNKKVIIASADMEKAGIIFKDVTKNLLIADPMFREGLVGSSKIENLTTQVSKKGLAWSSGGSINCVTLSESKKTSEVKGSGGIGIGADILLIDESALISDENYSVAIRMGLESLDFKLLEISNPHRRNHFFRTMHNEKTSKIWINADDALEQERIKQSQIDELREEMTTREFNSYVLCQFQESGKTAFSLLENTFTNNLSTNPTVVIGIDVARFTDYTVIVGFDIKHQQTFHERFTNISLDILKTRIIDIWKKLGCPKINIDCTGIGFGLFEELKNWIANIEGITFTQKIKADLVQNLQRLIQNDNISILKDEFICKEFANYEFYESKNGGISYSAPIGEHDDTVIAIGLACLEFKTQTTNNNTLWII